MYATTGLGNHGPKFMKSTLYLIFVGIVEIISYTIVRAALEVELKDLGLYEFDYIDFILRHISSFFVIMLLPMLVARIATDEGVGKHKVVTLRIQIAETVCYYGSFLAALIILFLQILGHMEYIPRELFSPVKHDMYCYENSYMCVWVHYTIRIFALPYNTIVSSCALPVLLGLRKPELIVRVVVIKNIIWIVCVFFSLYILNISLLGVGLSDFLCNFIAYKIWKRLLRNNTTFRENYKFKEVDNRIKTPNFKATRKKPGDSGGNNDSKDSCLGGRCCRPSYACRFCCYMCKGRDRLYNEIRKQFWGDLFVMGVRSTILLAVDAAVTLIFDAENVKKEWTVNTAFDAIHRISSIPYMFGNAVSCVLIVVGSKYLNEIYRVYNPYDYENLAKRFPTVALVCGMLCSISAVVLASFLVGSPLTKASGLMDWTGIFPFILAQTFSVTAQIYEGLLFASLDFQYLMIVAVMCAFPYVACVGAAFYQFHYTSLLWTALAIFSSQRLYLVYRRIHHHTLPKLEEESNNIDEFDALLNDTDDEEDAIFLRTIRLK